MNISYICCAAVTVSHHSPLNGREFNKLRGQLQRKRHRKIELCVRLNALRFFQFDHVVGFLAKAENERFTAGSSRCKFRTSCMKISRCHLADYVQKLHQKACRTCSMIIFLYLTDEVIDLWGSHFPTPCVKLLIIYVEGFPKQSRKLHTITIKLSYGLSSHKQNNIAPFSVYY